MPVKGRPRLVSHHANTTKLFVDDRREVIALSTSEKKCVSDVIRELVHEALRTRRFRAFGRDEGDEFIRNLHREAIAEGVNPMITELVALRQMVERFPPRMAEEIKPVIAKAAQNEQAILEIISQVLSHVMISQHITKVLATIAMQKDHLNSEQVKGQLAAQQQAGAFQARTITEKILAHCALLAPTADANRNEEDAR
ncbi:MAG: hypothetical protein MOB07_10780 [Acidobacteria bacterium]|nr:hypothetical protein [Acidobacteriota bacterium]